MTSSNDLLPRATAGDSAAFLQLVEQSAPPLHLYIVRHARGVLGADCDAEDVLQATLCKAWELAVAGLLTGMGRDGAEELRLLKEKGAVTFAQDKDSSVVHGMPGEAIKLDAAMLVLAPEKTAPVLANLANHGGNTRRDP